MYELMEKWLTRLGVSGEFQDLAQAGAALLFVLLLVIVSSWISRRLLTPLIERIVRQSTGRWDDTLVGHGFFKRLSSLLPVIVAYVSADLLLGNTDRLGEVIRRLALTAFVLITVRVLDAFLSGIRDIYNSSELSRQKPISGYLDVLKIVIYILGVIFVVAVLTNKSPWGILSVLGGLTAVLILVFKDTILGFAASLQISAHDMVRIGDWIEAPQYGADGDVIEVSVHTVKVCNWDKTITTIPTYGLVSGSFKNWRGMSESGGRRIKRAIHIDMKSIRFVSDEMLEQFAKIDLLKKYLPEKIAEIDADNRAKNIDTTVMPNGRRQTNIGVFRAYVVAYLKAHPKIHQEMTFLVRQLQPTAQGLPLEIYVFSRDQVWANYEAIQADIFDHLLAALPIFDLTVFQYPTGDDLRMLGGFKSPPAQGA